MNLDLENKTALVMSGSKGIGKGIAAALLIEGVSVSICSSNLENLERTQGELHQLYGKTPNIYKMDVSNLEEAARVFDQILKEQKAIDILITNGPGPRPLSTTELKLSDLDVALTINLKSTVLACNKVMPMMIKKKFGRIIHLTSTTGKEPDEGMVLSNMTRAAVLAYSKTLAKELAIHGITSNAILTGGVLTARTETLIQQGAKDKGIEYKVLLDQAGKSFPVGYIASPEQFAHTIVYLASPLSSFVNGISLPIDGGLMKSI